MSRDMGYTRHHEIVHNFLMPSCATSAVCSLTIPTASTASKMRTGRLAARPAMLTLLDQRQHEWERCPDWS